MQTMNSYRHNVSPPEKIPECVNAPGHVAGHYGTYFNGLELPRSCYSCAVRARLAEDLWAGLCKLAACVKKC
jgi:hypothetical protein